MGEAGAALTVPAALTGPDLSAAVALLARHHGLDGSAPAASAAFDSWAGGGDAPGVRHRFTADDVVAAGLYGAVLEPAALLDLLDRRAAELTGLLAAVPVDVDLVDAAPDLVGADSPAWRLWSTLLGIDGIGWAVAGTLLARKRPRLVPVYDEAVRRTVGAPRHYWRALQAALQADGGALHRRLLDVRQRAGLGAAVAPLRVFDVIARAGG